MALVTWLELQFFTHTFGSHFPSNLSLTSSIWFSSPLISK